MKYYSEEDMKDTRLFLEDNILNWPKVTTKKMFGCPCYKADEKLFAFIVTKGVVLTKLTESDRNDLATKLQITPFQAGTRTVKSWARISVEDNKSIDQIMPYVKKSYENALDKN